jgi:hypothetical protein
MRKSSGVVAERRPLILRLVFGVVALIMVAALILVGCSRSGRDPVTRLSAQREMLSEGYSLLYADATKIDRVELVLYVKAESQEFNTVITAISAYGEELKEDLERLAADYPGVRIDLVPLPEMEQRKRFAIGQDRVLQFIPFGGDGRVEYERTMLISLSNALNHESHLCRVMATEEPDPGLKKFLLDAEQRYVTLYERALQLLDRDHFRKVAKS